VGARRAAARLAAPDYAWATSTRPWRSPAPPATRRRGSRRAARHTLASVALIVAVAALRASLGAAPLDWPVVARALLLAALVLTPLAWVVRAGHVRGVGNVGRRRPAGAAAESMHDAPVEMRHEQER
jgi:hypothetical protein